MICLKPTNYETHSKLWSTILHGNRLYKKQRKKKEFEVSHSAKIPTEQLQLTAYGSFAVCSSDVYGSNDLEYLKYNIFIPILEAEHRFESLLSNSITVNPPQINTAHNTTSTNLYKNCRISSMGITQPHQF
jgi:hypothetical protein